MWKYEDRGNQRHNLAEDHLRAKYGIFVNVSTLKNLKNKDHILDKQEEEDWDSDAEAASISEDATERVLSAPGIADSMDPKTHLLLLLLRETQAIHKTLQRLVDHE